MARERPARQVMPPVDPAITQPMSDEMWRDVAIGEILRQSDSPGGVPWTGFRDILPERFYDPALMPLHQRMIFDDDRLFQGPFDLDEELRRKREERGFPADVRNDPMQELTQLASADGGDGAMAELLWTPNPGEVPVYVDIRDRTSTKDMTPAAMTQLRAAARAAADAGLSSLAVVAGKGGGHKSHSAGTEWDLMGYDADGSKWGREHRVVVAEGARRAGADRFGFYEYGKSRPTADGRLHIGASGRGRPRAVWGAGGKTSGAASRKFTSAAEKDFLAQFNAGAPLNVAQYTQGAQPTMVADADRDALIAAVDGMEPEQAMAAMEAIHNQYTQEGGARPIAEIAMAYDAEAAPAQAAVPEQEPLDTSTILRRSRGFDPQVLNLQIQLQKAGLELDSDGKFGPETEQAVRTYQEQNNLDVDGVVGPQTWAALSGAGEPDADPRFPQYTQAERKAIQESFDRRTARMTGPRVTTGAGAEMTLGKPDAPPAPPPVKEYIVKPGDNLWDIARNELGAGERYSDIKKASGIESDTLQPGQRLVIPTEEAPAASADPMLQLLETPGFRPQYDPLNSVNANPAALLASLRQPAPGRMSDEFSPPPGVRQPPAGRMSDEYSAPPGVRQPPAGRMSDEFTPPPPPPAAVSMGVPPEMAGMDRIRYPQPMESPDIYSNEPMGGDPMRLMPSPTANRQPPTGRMSDEYSQPPAKPGLFDPGGMFGFTDKSLSDLGKSASDIMRFFVDPNDPIVIPQTQGPAQETLIDDIRRWLSGPEPDYSKAFGGGLPGLPPLPADEEGSLRAPAPSVLENDRISPLFNFAPQQDVDPMAAIGAWQGGQAAPGAWTGTGASSPAAGAAGARSMTAPEPPPTPEEMFDQVFGAPSRQPAVVGRAPATQVMSYAEEDPATEMARTVAAPPSTTQQLAATSQTGSGGRASQRSTTAGGSSGGGADRTQAGYVVTSRNPDGSVRSYRDSSGRTITTRTDYAGHTSVGYSR